MRIRYKEENRQRMYTTDSMAIGEGYDTFDMKNKYVITFSIPGMLVEAAYPDECTLSYEEMKKEVDAFMDCAYETGAATIPAGMILMFNQYDLEQ